MVARTPDGQRKKRRRRRYLPPRFRRSLPYFRYEGCPAKENYSRELNLSAFTTRRQVRAGCPRVHQVTSQLCPAAPPARSSPLPPPAPSPRGPGVLRPPRAPLTYNHARQSGSRASRRHVRRRDARDDDSVSNRQRGFCGSFAPALALPAPAQLPRSREEPSTTRTREKKGGSGWRSVRPSFALDRHPRLPGASAGRAVSSHGHHRGSSHILAKRFRGKETVSADMVLVQLKNSTDLLFTYETTTSVGTEQLITELVELVNARAKLLRLASGELVVVTTPNARRPTKERCFA
ncbi:MAG: hypothetical protein BJ554DRAFT_4765 [Olpidium bornovanus]|uniref:Uncharacterized protein n=1 Tax=Olpidium bornovanus TaxID=278681 RepID=A0A8H7ZZW0_9FUNG|nr:MAG: hypothetical protein BJ554DRAFT_4765 [Olpidium bornovanus]